MDFIDLFAGIGGFSLGLERAGMNCVAHVEINDFCGEMLKKHWPDVPLYKDVRNVGKHNLPSADLVCGGFPCQPFSNAGNRRGTEDDRYLWPEMLRVIQEVKPTWVIGENVGGLVNMEFKRLPAKVESRAITRSEDYDFYKAFLSRQEIMLLDKLCQELEAEGYEVQPIIIPACAVNAPHRRDRVWIVGYSERKSRREEPKRGLDLGGKLLQKQRRTENTNRTQAPSDEKDVPNANIQGLPITSRREQPSVSRKTETLPGREPGRGEMQRRGGAWDVEPDVGRVAHGVPDRVDRLKSLGNAVVPQVVEVIGRAILDSYCFR